MSLLYSTTNVSLIEHVSKIVSILLSKLCNCPNANTSLCYCTTQYGVFKNQLRSGLHYDKLSIFNIIDM